jgi:hypothetical protein
VKKNLSDPIIKRPLIFTLIWMVTPSASAAYFYYLTNRLHLPPSFLGTLKVVEGCSSIVRSATPPDVM